MEDYPQYTYENFYAKNLKVMVKLQKIWFDILGVVIE